MLTPLFRLASGTSCTHAFKMACTIAAAAPVAVRPVAATPLKQARNTFAARTVSNGSIKKTTAMQGEEMRGRRG